jgi:hypothetical protein
MDLSLELGCEDRQNPIGFRQLADRDHELEVAMTVAGPVGQRRVGADPFGGLEDGVDVR